MMADDTTAKQDWIWGGAAVVLAIVLFSPSIANGFVFDDHYFVQANRYLRSWDNLWLLVSDWRANGYNFVQGGFWRPLRNISYLIDYTLGGGGPAVFHMGNVLWHGLAVCGLFALARRLGIGTIFAFIAAAAFAVHPAQTESVAWIKERDGLMCGAFLFWALYHSMGRNALSIIWSLLLACGALLSKETGVVYTPLVLCCGWVAAKSGSEHKFPRRFLLLAAGGFVLTIIYLLLRSAVLGQVQQAQTPPGGTYWATLTTMPRVFLEYMRIVVYPMRLELFYQWIKPAGLASPLVWAGLVVLAGIIGFSYTQRNQRPVVAVGMLWFLIALVPVSNVLPTLQWMAVRFLYIPLAGLALAVAFLAQEAYGKLIPQGKERIIWLMSAVILGIWALLSFSRVAFIWTSDLTLFAEAHMIWPEREEIKMGYAEHLLKEGYTERAGQLLATYPYGDEPYPFDLAWRLRLEFLTTTGQWDEARSSAETALEKFPENTGIITAAGFVYAQSADPERAIEIWERGLELNPNHVTILSNLAVAYSEVGRTEDASRVTERAQRLRSGEILSAE